MLSENDCCFSSDLFSFSHRQCVGPTCFTQSVTHKLWSHLLQGWVNVIQARLLTDLTWFAQSFLRPAWKNKKHAWAHYMLTNACAQTHTLTHARMHTSVCSGIDFFYYNNVAPFCPKIIFEVDGIGNWRALTHAHTQITQSGYKDYKDTLNTHTGFRRERRIWWSLVSKAAERFD